MKGLRLTIAVLLTSIVLVVAIAAIGVLAVPGVLARTTGLDAWQFGPRGFGGPGFEFPPELQGLMSVPPAERFDHFVGVQVSLKDKDNQPLTITVTPGKVTAANGSSLNIAANDGTTKTFAIDGKTVLRGKPSQGTPVAGQATLTAGDKVIVATMNGSATALAVVDGGANGFSAAGPSGWWHPGAGWQ
jgi:hypothetical protein